MSIRKLPDTRCRKGFTLIEVMLALSLTAMLLGLLSTGVFVVADDWNRNTDIFDQSLDESLAILQIDRALHGAFPHSFTNRELLSRQIYFTGTDDFISWVTTASPQRRPGLTAWEMFAVRDEGVYLKTVPAFSDDPSLRLEQAEATLILPGHDIELSYLYEDLDESLIWTQEWEGEERLSLPLAIHVRFIPDEDQSAGSVDKEVLARVRNNIHRSIRPNLNE
ncbi:MAG: prepilin-type N-terminal cleavage/methylation domain-containing protein [Pseudomonadales bacterium]|nr:prepilin-type N-terminal cleavage/methylation domain-containing protein [Pseudomonadales bacterium]